MDNTTKLLGGIFGSALSSAAWLADMESIVSMVCAILGIIITVTTCCIIPIWKKIRDAKKDGVITPEEAEDIAKTAKDGIDIIENMTKKEEEK